MSVEGCEPEGERVPAIGMPHGRTIETGHPACRQTAHVMDLDRVYEQAWACGKAVPFVWVKLCIIDQKIPQ